jgi:hypothetical protein
MFVRIDNLLGKKGQIDYKGIDMDDIVIGTQVYPHGAPSYCILETEQTTFPDNPDITVLTEQEYNDLSEQMRAEIEANQPVDQVQILTSQVETLQAEDKKNKQTNAKMLLALARSGITV